MRSINSSATRSGRPGAELRVSPHCPIGGVGKLWSLGAYEARAHDGPGNIRSQAGNGSEVPSL
jgi:hypothetical protein